MLVGLGLAAAAAKPRPNPLLNVLALAGGSYLAWRGYVGNCPVKAALTDGHGGGRLTHEG
jgi:threonine/homoserine/homoserine lactone efflux protein